MMFEKEKLNFNPFLKALLENRVDEIKKLKNLKWQTQVDRHGFNPLEIAQLLGCRQCEKVFLSEKTSSLFKIQLQKQDYFSHLSESEFEKKMHLTFRQFLTFPSYPILEEIIRNCPYFFRLEWLFGGEGELETRFQNQTLRGEFANTYVKWINPELGYGLFAATDFPEKTFIGEYTGIARAIDRKNPKLNDYCFHYPTRFWSKKYYVIDALHEGNLARFINHSNRPNLQPLWLMNRGVLHLVFITNQLITEGTELTFDYGVDYWQKRKKYV